MAPSFFLMRGVFMPELIATVDLKSPPVKAGERFHATDLRAKLLRAYGKARNVDARDAKAVKAMVEEVFPDPVKPKRRYRRRDMRSDD